ncbi:MAG: fibronectin type III domain-containing protein, partial [Actinomycetota bacterium]
TATAYDTTGNTTTDTNTVTIDNAAPPVPVDDTASSGSTLSGTTTGTIGDTLADDGVAFAITEEETGGKPSSRTSLLEQTWDFQVTGGEVVTFYVNAWASGSAEGETFGFSYTSDGGDTWVDMLTVSSTSDLGYQQFVLPPSVDGNVTVRVVDDDRSAGNRVLDTLLVDHMFFLSEPVGQGPAPAAPSLLTAVGGAGMVSLSWSDNASDELGYEVERRLPTGVWSVISALPADTTSFTDLGVVAGTTYEYRVHGYSAGGVSEYSPTSTATVEEVTIALTATGFKQRALQKVQLDWTGSDLVNILRDGAIVASNVSGSSWVDNLDIKGEGTYVYQVCDASSGACSNTATVVF